MQIHESTLIYANIVHCRFCSVQEKCSSVGEQQTLKSKLQDWLHPVINRTHLLKAAHVSCLASLWSVVIAQLKDADLSERLQSEFPVGSEDRSWWGLPPFCSPFPVIIFTVNSFS